MLPVQVSEWNETEVEYPRDLTVAQIFGLQAARTPEAIAVVAGDCRLSYRELDAWSNRLARYLQSLGVKPETLVGVALGRCASIIVSLLAILKAGGAYVPLDPNHPKDRLSLVIEDSHMPVLITGAEARGQLPSAACRLVDLDNEAASVALQSADAVASDAVSRNLAYVLFTSGSTGRPKGVMVEHRNVANFFAGMDRVIGCKQGTWLAVTSVSFDISILEILWTLTRGFKVVLHGDEGTSTIGDEIIRHGVTHLQMTPSLARLLMLDSRAYVALGSLRQILLGGEALPSSLIHQLRRIFKGEIYNMYGPTETTIWSTTYHVEEPGSTIPIGRPVANTQTYVLDAGLSPVEEGAIGELFIGGDGVARGYLNQPDLTQERFLSVPSLSKTRLYRTGDLVRWLPDGNIEFLGRADYQMKLHGFRIEPGEIEALLERHPGVRQAVVILREDREGDKRLVAYLVCDASGPPAVSALRSALRLKLPEYMVPSSFVFLPEMPLTDNGKTDRKALLCLPPPVAPTDGTAGNRPESEIERIITEAWKEALGISNVGVDSNFFDLGAHSLTVAEVQANLQQMLGREIDTVDFYQFSTVRALASHLGGAAPQNQASDRAQRRLAARRK